MYQKNMYQTCEVCGETRILKTKPCKYLEVSFMRSLDQIGYRYFRNIYVCGLYVDFLVVDSKGGVHLVDVDGGCHIHHAERDVIRQQTLSDLANKFGMKYHVFNDDRFLNVVG